MINEKVVLDETTDEWVLPNLDISGNALRLNNPNADIDQQDLSPEMIEEMKINELVKSELETHPNVYFAYGEDGSVVR